MIDIHCHMLPGVDDGADCTETACAMAAAAARGGTEAMIVTPHCGIPQTRLNYAGAALFRRFAALRGAVAAAGIPLRLYLGAEAYCTPELPRLVREKQVLTLAGSRYLLTEFSFEQDAQAINDMLAELAETGVVPIVAHPERYEAVQQDPWLLKRWFDGGYLIQINKDSILGALGRRARHTADWALRAGLAHILASDGHSAQQRNPDLSYLREVVETAYSPVYAQILLEENPHRVLENLPMVEA